MADLPNTLTCSMTRANKLLAQLREGSSSSQKTRGFRRRSSYLSEPTSNTYHQEVSMLYFTNADVLKSSLNDMQQEYFQKVLRKNLIERWKNRMFELNIKYGIHNVLSAIDCLQQEKSMLAEALAAIIDKHCISVESLLTSMNAVSSSEKKYEFKWNVGIFDRDMLNKRLKDIKTELSKLDESRDKLNIENSFSIELSSDEKAILNT